MTRPRVLWHVQHLVGTGHLRRSAVVAAALAERGADVCLVTGGEPLPDLDAGAARVVQLPAARAANLTFRSLVDAHGRPVDHAWRAERRRRLLDEFDAFAPHVLVVESFPFGRRLLRFELVPLLERAGARANPPAIACSVRDILEPRDDPARYRQMAAAVEAHFDRVLVHSDPSLIDFGDTFPEYAAIQARVSHTGFVVDPRPSARGPGDGDGEVIVSAGGGAVGERLLRAAIGARAASERLARATWRVLVGPALGADAARGLAALAGPGVIVEPNRGDFAALLGRCRVSISQAGYNTVLDVLRAGAPAVLVPHAAGAEREQGIRAGLVARRGLAEVVDEASLAPALLARAVDAADARGRGRGVSIDTGGADRSAAMLLESAASRVP